MVVVFISILFLIAGYVLARSTDKARAVGRPLMAFGGILFLVGILFSTFVQIDAGYVGVQKLYGSVQKDVLYSGLHMINPLLEVEQIETRTQNYTMSGIHDEGDKSGDDAIRVLSADGLEVTIDLTVLFRVMPATAPDLYKQTGPEYVNKIVRPISRTKIRDNAVYYDAVSLYSSKRDEFQVRIYKAIEDDFKKRGLVLENLLIRNISLPMSVKTAIESKINAEQEAQKMQFVLQKERQEAERKRVEAQGIADYQRIVNENLTDRQLQYEQIKAMRELAGSSNAKIIVMGKGSTPMILDAK
jgi:regulator of protease activity HflC (stomatin/prohibitin superfamily)